MIYMNTFSAGGADRLPLVTLKTAVRGSPFQLIASTRTHTCACDCDASNEFRVSDWELYTYRVVIQLVAESERL